MISEDLIKDVNFAVQKTMKLKHVKGYDCKIEGKSKYGDNYMGEVIFVKVIPEEDSDKTYDFVVKTAKRSEIQRKMFPVDLFYKREMFIYSVVFPIFTKMLTDKNNVMQFDFVPHMYWIDKIKGKETIVLNNLKSEGFKLYNKVKPWNLSHSLLTMKHYGKLHALSIALKDQKPELFDGLRHHLGPVAPSWTQKLDMKKFYQESFDHAMSLLRKNGREDLVDKYDAVFNEIEEIFKNETIEEDKITICHMDCWNNNFMFKYESEDESSPSEVRFLDFQLSLFDSPAKDLSYNIYTTCDNTCLNHFEELLQTYHDSLRQSLQSLGCDPAQFLNMKDLRRHWRKYGIYGIFLALTIIKIIFTKKNEESSMEEKDREENVMDGLKIEVTNQEECDRRILEVYLHFGENFL